MYKFNIKRNLALAIFISIIISVLILLFRVDFHDLYKINSIALILAVCFTFVVIILKGIRMHILAKTIINDDVSILNSLLVRSGSEFIALISPAYAGDEIFRMWYLNRIGINIKHAIWVSYLDLFMDVFVGFIYGAAAGVYLILLQINFLLGAIVIMIISIILIIHILLIFVLYGGESIIEKVNNILSKSRVTNLLSSWIQKKLEESRKAGQIPKKIIIKSILYTLPISLVIGISAGLVLRYSLLAVDINISILDSIFALYVSLTITALPVTIGGSGLTEASLAIYLSSLLNETPWLSIVVYRFASYFIALVITGACLSTLVYTEFLKK